MSGKFGLGSTFPAASRFHCQPSSMLMYWYPAACMPVSTMASAISRMVLSLICVWNLFQLFHPIGGVLASPFDGTSRRGGNSTLGRAA